MTKQELEIRYKVLEERMERIYELCKKYTGISNGAETIGEIEANSDPDIIEQIINWRKKKKIKRGAQAPLRL